MSRVSLAYALPVVFVLAFCARTPALGLPVEGESAVLAATAARAAEGDLEVLGRAAPLTPALVALGTRLGASPTAALRAVDALAAALLAPLLLLLALALGWTHTEAALASLLIAVHPLALAGAGDIAPGSASVALALFLGALVLLLSAGAGRRRLGAAAALLLLLADGAALALALPLLVLYARRETAPRWQTAVSLLGIGLLAGALLTWFAWRPAVARSLGGALLWGLAATLGVLLVALPGGLRRLLASPGGRTLVCATAAALLLWVAGGPVAAPTFLPCLLLAGVAGSAAWAPRWRRRLLPAAAGGALVASMWLVCGGLQVALLPTDPPTAGRLHLLRNAVRRAAQTAGDGGWIVLAVGAGRPEEQASLADLNPGHWTWTERAGDADATALRRLMVFPAASFEPGRSVAIVAAAGREAGIHTFDGAGIYRQDVVQEVGPYVVLQARRP